MQNEQQHFPHHYVPVANEQAQSQQIPLLQHYGGHPPEAAPFNPHQGQQPWQAAAQQPVHLLQQSPLPQVPLQHRGMPVQLGVEGLWNPSFRQPQQVQHPAYQPGQPLAPAVAQLIYQQAPPPDHGPLPQQLAFGQVEHESGQSLNEQDDRLPQPAAAAAHGGNPGYSSTQQDDIARGTVSQAQQAAPIYPRAAQTQGAAGEYYNRSTYEPVKPAEEPHKHGRHRRHHKQPTETTIQPGPLGFLKATIHMCMRKSHLHEDTTARHGYIKRLDQFVNHSSFGKLLPIGSTRKAQLRPEADRLGAVLEGKPAHEIDWSGVANGEDRKRRHERRLATGASQTPDANTAR